MLKQSKGKKRQSVIWTILTFLSTSFGIGFLSLPIAAAYTGIYYFIFLCLLIAVMNYHSNFALVTIGTQLKAKNYPMLITKLIKSKTQSFIILGIMFVNIMGTIVSFTVGIQQSLTENMTYLGFLLNKQFPSFMG